MISLMPVNFIGVIAATVVAMVVGSIWYSPIAFGKKWEKLSGQTMGDMKKANKAMAMMLVFALISAVVLQQFVEFANATSAISGAFIGLLAWLGFVATATSSRHTFEGAPWDLYILNNANWLVTYVLMGVVLTLV